ncbi:MAG TPA: hypothetical protein PKC43_01425 [Phycisphaerales bacterium]|nr:hypothetical protein [Phycisphaerales bacterium]HMP36086.1 hypothetical protein [Phycisphaerales bacterium]
MEDPRSSDSRATAAAGAAPADEAPPIAVMWAEWKRRQRRYVQGQALILLLGAALVGYMAWSTASIIASAPATQLPWFRPALLLFPLLVLWWPLVTALSLRRALRALRRVPLHDGALCWNCVLPLQPDGERRRCPRCGVRTSAGNARTWWEQSQVSPVWAARWRSLRRGNRRRWRRRVRSTFAWRFRRHPRLRGTIVGGLAMLPTLAAIAVVGAFVGSVALVPWVFVLLIIFGVTGALAGPSLGGVERLCTACGYGVGMTGEKPQRCPECGADWRIVGATRIATRQERKSPNPAAALAMFLGIGLVFGCFVLVISRPDWIARPLPTGVLAMLVGEPLLGAGAAAELQRRPLTAAEERRVIERLLVLRRKGTLKAFSAREVLDPFVLAGRVPADLLRRYLVESADLTIEAPELWEGRGVLVARIRVADHSGAGSSPNVGALFGGWTIDGHPAPGPAGAPASIIHAMLLLDSGRSHGGIVYSLAPELRIKPEELWTLGIDLTAGGTLQLAATAWFVLAPGHFGGAVVQWNADGSPVPPAGSLLVEPVRVERSVRVAPIAPR